MAVSHAHPLETAIAALVGGYHRDPFSLLGPHAEDGAPVVRAFYPAAERVDVRLGSSGGIRPVCMKSASTIRAPTTGCGSPIPATRWSSSTIRTATARC